MSASSPPTEPTLTPTTGQSLLSELLSEYIKETCGEMQREMETLERDLCQVKNNFIEKLFTSWRNSLSDKIFRMKQFYDNCGWGQERQSFTTALLTSDDFGKAFDHEKPRIQKKQDLRRHLRNNFFDLHIDKYAAEGNDFTAPFIEATNSLFATRIRGFFYAQDSGENVLHIPLQTHFQSGTYHRKLKGKKWKAFIEGKETMRQKDAEQHCIYYVLHDKLFQEDCEECVDSASLKQMTISQLTLTLLVSQSPCDTCQQTIIHKQEEMRKKIATKFKIHLHEVHILIAFPKMHVGTKQCWKKMGTENERKQNILFLLLEGDTLTEMVPCDE